MAMHAFAHAVQIRILMSSNSLPRGQMRVDRRSVWEAEYAHLPTLQENGTSASAPHRLQVALLQPRVSVERGHELDHLARHVRLLGNRQDRDVDLARLVDRGRDVPDVIG